MEGSGPRFWISNVFVSDSGGGNQLAVVESLGGLSSEQMQRVAADFNFAETTFIEGAVQADGPVPVRIFTPRRELPFAGHPVLGTADMIRRLRAAPYPCTVTLSVGVGEVPVEFASESVPAFMTQRAAEFDPGIDGERAARILSLTRGDLSGAMSPAFVSTGARFLLVPLGATDAVSRARIDAHEYERFSEEAATLGIGVFAPMTDDFTRVAVRVFAPGAGVPEDPATGSHAGCLGALLARELDWGREQDVVLEQGRELARPSILHVRVKKGEPPRVGGRCVVWAEGRLGLA